VKQKIIAVKRSSAVKASSTSLQALTTMARSTKTNSTKQASSSTPTKITTMALGRKTELRGLESSIIIKGSSTRGNGAMTHKMASGRNIGQTAHILEDIFVREIKNQANSNGPIKVHTAASSSITNFKERVNFYGRINVATKAHGKIISCMGMASFPGQMAKPLRECTKTRKNKAPVS
jgi:hypothetical protein